MHIALAVLWLPSLMCVSRLTAVHWYLTCQRLQEMTVAVHEALGAHAEPFADSIEAALDRLLRATAISNDDLPPVLSSVHDLVLNPTA